MFAGGCSLKKSSVDDIKNRKYGQVIGVSAEHGLSKNDFLALIAPKDYDEYANAGNYPPGGAGGSGDDLEVSFTTEVNSLKSALPAGVAFAAT
ncbi:MAG: hypothetical protein FWE62_00820, partial [Firmicutes bacterium]|nr:hypothetical protein [Bacillota bacterium]